MLVEFDDENIEIINSLHTKHRGRPFLSHVIKFLLQIPIPPRESNGISRRSGGVKLGSVSNTFMALTLVKRLCTLS